MLNWKAEVYSCLMIFLVLAICGLPLPLHGDSSMSLSAEPECYKPGKKINLVIGIPTREIQNPHKLKLTVNIHGTNLKYSSVLTSDEINNHLEGLLLEESVDMSEKSENKNERQNFSVPYEIPKDQTGFIVITLTLSRNKEIISILQKSIFPVVECKKNETQSNQNPIPGFLPEAKVSIETDYRERIITGHVNLEKTEWLEFPLTIKAEKTRGGGIERTTIFVSKEGRYNYRIGNLYREQYNLELNTVEQRNGVLTVNFDKDETSKTINFNIPNIKVINLGVYDLYTSDIALLTSGKYKHQLKAYICRFDDSAAKNLRFNWRFGDKYYYDNLAPEKNRCLPFYPEPVILDKDEKVMFALEVNPEIVPSKSIGSSVWTRFARLPESNWTDNVYVIEITGGMGENN